MQRGDFGARLLLLAEGTFRETCTVSPPELGLGVVRPTSRKHFPQSSYDYKVTSNGGRRRGLTLQGVPCSRPTTWLLMSVCTLLSVRMAQPIIEGPES